MYKITFRYDRDDNYAPIVTYVVVEKGNKCIGRGDAVCHTLDMPVKEVGRKLALTRAIKKLPLAQRKEIWNVYFTR